MKHSSHHPRAFVLLGALIGLYASHSAAQSASQTVTEKFIIDPATGPSGLVTMGVPVPANGEFVLENELGDLSLVLPAANAQPSTAGQFGIFKRTSSTTVQSILDVVPGTTTDQVIISGKLTVSGGVLFGSGAAFTSPYPGAISLGAEYGTVATNYRSVALGGWNNKAYGDGSVVIGGTSYSSSENQANATASTIIGSSGGVANAMFSSIIGSYGSKILNSSSVYSSILGGNGNEMDSTSQGYNAIIAGWANKFINSGACSAIISGSQNEMVNGGYQQIIVGGQLNKINNSTNSAIIGGANNTIKNGSGGWGHSFMASGNGNTVETDSVLAVLIGGGNTKIYGGWSNAAVAALNSSIGTTSTSAAPGNANVILGGDSHLVNDGIYGSAILGGYGNITAASNQVVLGTYNAADSGKLFIIGKGSSGSARSNALTVDGSGNVEAAGTIAAPQIIITGGADDSDISMGPFTAAP